MNTTHLYGAWKTALWAGGSLAVMATALIADVKEGMNPLVQVALITSTASLLVAIITGGVSIYMQYRTGKKVDGLFTDAHASEKAANTRADTAEAFTKGSDSEREREK
jgi:hypothetical protein